jgi:hypothetical protein
VRLTLNEGWAYIHSRREGLISKELSESLKTSWGGKMDESSKQCPFCKLTNPGSALVCDCGYRFMGNVTDPYQVKMLKEKKAKVLITTGASSLGLGLALTLLVSLVASLAGIYVLFWGLIFGGLIALLKGLHIKRSIRKLGV